MFLHAPPSPSLYLHPYQQALLQHVLAGSDITTAVRNVADEAASVSLEHLASQPVLPSAGEGGGGAGSGAAGLQGGALGGSTGPSLDDGGEGGSMPSAQMQAVRLLQQAGVLGGGGGGGGELGMHDGGGGGQAMSAATALMLSGGGRGGGEGGGYDGMGSPGGRGGGMDHLLNGANFADFGIAGLGGANWSGGGQRSGGGPKGVCQVRAGGEKAGGGGHDLRTLYTVQLATSLDGIMEEQHARAGWAGCTQPIFFLLSGCRWRTACRS